MSAPFLIVALLVVIGAIFALGASLQYSRYHRKYLAIARSVCDPGSFRISFHVRTLLLKGRVSGRVMRYSVFGDERRSEVSSYLLLEHPVRGNFRFYSGGDLGLVDPSLREGIRALDERPGFRALFVSSKRTPFIAVFVTRPLGFAYHPGLLLWKWGNDAFDPDAVGKDFHLLLRLAKDGI